MSKLTHFDQDGNARMVDIGGKEDTERIAVASGEISVSDPVLRAILSDTVEKGDVLGVARLAGIMGAKNTSQAIPMCHPLMLTGIDISFDIDEEKKLIQARARVKTRGKTGVEMEALTAVSTSLLTIYDMVKAIDKSMEISNIRLESKSGGKSGDYKRKED